MKESKHNRHIELGTSTTNRRALVAGAITGIIGAGGAIKATAAQPAPKVDVCHLTGNGTYNLISVNGNALDAHLRHGDKLPHPVFGCISGCTTTEVFVDAKEHLRRNGTRLPVGPFYKGDSVKFQAYGQVDDHHFGPDGHEEVCNRNGHLPDQNFNCGSALFYSFSPTDANDADVRWLGSDQTLSFTENDIYIYLFIETSQPKSGGYTVSVTTCWE